MRRRAYTSLTNVEKPIEPKFLREQYERIKMELSMLTQKYELLQKQRDILKQGNNNLVSQFLFNTHRQQLNRLQRQVKQRTQENTELKKIITQLEEMVKSVMDSEKEGSIESSNKYQSSRRFSIRVENDDRNITVGKWSSIGDELKIQLKDLIDNYKKLVKNKSGRLFKTYSNNYKKSIQKNQKTMKFCQSQIITPSYQQHHEYNHQQQVQKKTQQIQQMSMKIKQLSVQNGQLKQKIQRLAFQLVNNNNNNNNSDKNNDKRISYNQSTSLQKQTHPNTTTIFHLNDYTIPMSTSQIHTEQLQKSIIYDKFSQSSSSFMQQSTVTESYDKRINKLQKTNSILQKDYQLAKQKIKSLNREYSKLKLDFLKIDQDKRRVEENYQRKISVLNDKIQMLNKKLKDLQLLNQKTKSQKNKQIQLKKHIISQHQSKIVQLQQKIQKNSIQMSHLKQQMQLSKKQQQKQNTHVRQLQIQRQKSKQLQKQLQQRTMNFQKSLKNYQTIIDDMRKINDSPKEKEKQRQQNKRIFQRQNKSRSRSRQSSTVNQHKSSILTSSQFISPSQASLLMTLRQQITLLQSTITTENQRYNILQNSNKELRQRLIRMIDNEERLRKQLINQRIKTRTNKSISQSSKYSQKARSVIKRGFDINNNDNMQINNSQYDDQEEYCESGSESRLDQLKINNDNMPSSSLSVMMINSTDRNNNSQSYIINPLYMNNSNNNNRTLKQSSSNRQFKSQSMIAVNKKDMNDIDRKISINMNNYNQSSSQMKMLRERRFDPKQTLVSSKKKDKETATSSKLLQLKRHDQQFNLSMDHDDIQGNKPQSPVDNFKYYAVNDKEVNQNSTLIKMSNKKQLDNQCYEPTYGRSTIIENNKSKSNQRNQQKSPLIKSPKYVYQPPKPKSISPTKPIKQTPLSSSEYHQPLIPTSEPPTDNKQISFQISQSQSNLSKGDRIIQLFSINNQTKTQESPYVNPFGENLTNTKPTMVRQQPVSVGKFSQLQMEKRQGNSNIVMSGKPQQQTKSSAQVRFTRKS